LAGCFFRATARAATGSQRFGEFLELDFGFVRRGKLAGEGFDFGTYISQEVKVQGLSVEQVLDIHQDRRQLAFGEKLVAGLESFVSVSLDASQQQVVFDR
jgi:hypothetical protein